MGPKKATKRAASGAAAAPAEDKKVGNATADADAVNAAGDAPVEPALNNGKKDGEGSPVKRGRGRPKKPDSEKKAPPKKAEEKKAEAKPVEAKAVEGKGDAKASPVKAQGDTKASPVKKGRGRPPKAK